MSCTAQQSEAGWQKAWDDGKRDFYAPILVRILQVNGTKVTIRAKGSTKTIDVDWGSKEDVFADCPTEAKPAGGPTSVYQLAYLGNAWDRLPKEAQLERRKWPEAEVMSRFPGETFPTAGARWGYQAYPVTLESLTIVGLVEGRDEESSHELLFRGRGPFTLDLGSGFVDIEIFENGDRKHVRIEAVKLLATGTGNLRGRDIDLLDLEYGNPYQVIQVAAEGPTLLELSQRGASAFGYGFRPLRLAARAQPAHDLVTFLAGPSEGTDTRGDDGNDTIEKIREKLTTGNVHDVSSLLDIATILNERRDNPPKTIQIVGHAAPGALALGYYWVPKYTEDDTGPFYLLDSNPYAYGLLSHFVDKGTRVVLAGCELGSDERGPLVAGGSTLVFSLYRMWGCEVFAADEMVASNDFENGYYVGSAIGMTANGWVRTHGQRVFTPTLKGTPKPRYKDVSVLGAPALGPSGKAVRIPDISPLITPYDEEIALTEHPLALDELVMYGKVDGQPSSLFLLAGGRILEARSPAGRRYFRPKGGRGPSDLGRITEDPSIAIWRAVRESLRATLI